VEQERILVSDFDGTMTSLDFYRVALEYLPLSAASIWERHMRKEIGLFDALAGIFDRLHCSEGQMEVLLKKTGLDPGIKKACNRLLASGWRLVIASAGCGWYIEKLLAPLNIEAEIHANPGHFSEQEGLIMELPTASPFFCRETGIDKTRLVREALGHNIVAFAGDGPPDLGPALLVPPSLRFAKGLLAEELRERGEGFIRFQSWSEVVDNLLNGRTGNR
jgi:2-hydroxy-3-keto-5-methylthiopentenyl-1-phosphate phosphatase